MSSNATVILGKNKSNLPILVGQSNFRRWYKTWNIALRRAKFWTVVCDGENKESRPIKRKYEKDDEFLVRREKYDDRNDIAHSAILNGVSEELQKLVCSCDDEPESARVAVRILKEKFDYKTTTSTIQLFKEFSELKMTEGDSISSDILNFETAYAHIYSRCADSSRPEAKALRSFLSVEQVKVMYLFLSLPTSFYKIIDNLTTKEDLRFGDVNRRLLDLNSINRKDITTSLKAFFSKGKPFDSHREIECTWCKKYGNNYNGHIFNILQKAASKYEAKIRKQK